MTAPLIYDDLSIGVTPTMVSDAANALVGTDPNNVGGSIGDVITSINRITTRISSLQLGWAGKTSQEVKAFFDQWNAAMTALFGTKASPRDGSLVRVATALDSAAHNYNAAEDSIAAMFEAFSEASSPNFQPVDDTAQIPPPAHWPLSWQDGPVGENFFD